MSAIRVIFDGKAFVPQEPVSLPLRAEAIVIVDQADPAAVAKLDRETAAYYAESERSEDDAWGNVVATDAVKAWEED